MAVQKTAHEIVQVILEQWKFHPDRICRSCGTQARVHPDGQTWGCLKCKRTAPADEESCIFDLIQKT